MKQGGKAKDLYNKLIDQVQQEWENKEAYQARMKAAREIQRQVEAYERVFNAEEYHLKRAKDVGYVSAEVLQLIFGGEIIKGVGKGLQLVSKGAKFIEGAEKLKLLGQPIKQGSKQLEWIMAKHGPKQLPKYAEKSKFYISTQTELETIIQNATHMPIGAQSYNGRIYRTVDAGKVIGFDSSINQSTNFYSVITDIDGNLITAFPGFPITP